MNILTLISGDIFVRHYLTTDAFDGLKDHAMLVVASDAVAYRSPVEARDQFVGYIAESVARVHKFNRLQKLLMVARRGRSRTFEFRMRRVLSRAEHICYRLASLPGLGALSTGLALRSLGTSETLRTLLEEHRPGLILIPSQITSLLEHDAIMLGKEMGIPTACLVDGWDNVSSKTTYAVKPDYLGVWGRQSEDQAVAIHGFDRSRISRLGTPRFDHYYRCRSPRPPSPYPFRYILFAGNAIPFDELTALRALDDKVAQMGLSDLKVVYRPHPWRQKRSCPDVFREEDFRHVVMDAQVKSGYDDFHSSPTPTDTFMPSLDYYPALLANALFCVCPLSTMMIESAIFDTPVLFLTYDDGYHLTSPHNAFRHYMHFDGIEKIVGFHQCSEQAGLGQMVAELYERYATGPRPDIAEAVGYYLHSDDRPYSQRLAEMIHAIGSRSGKS